jgi:hypothetical protein
LVIFVRVLISHQYKTKQNKTKQNKTKQNKTKQAVITVRVLVPHPPAAAAGGGAGDGTTYGGAGAGERAAPSGGAPIFAAMIREIACPFTPRQTMPLEQ